MICTGKAESLFEYRKFDFEFNPSDYINQNSLIQ